MIIRSFVADSVATALKEVRSQMGGNAVVLKTRQLTGSGEGKYEVTACLDSPTTAQANRTLTDRKATVASAVASEAAPAREVTPQVVANTSAVEERLASLEAKLDRLLSAEPSTTSDEPTVRDRLHDILRKADVPEEQVSHLIDDLDDETLDQEVSDTVVHSQIESMVDGMIDPGLQIKAGDRVLLLGPAGAGKTSSLGKLAAQLVIKQKLAVKLVTLDNANIGAFDEIASYAELLGLDVSNPTFANSKTDDSADTDKVVLIDTGSLPKGADALKAFTEHIKKLNPTHRLAVFSATTRSRDLAAFAGALSSLEPSHLVFTMTDLTDCRGGLLTAAAATGLKIALTSSTPSGSGSLEKPAASKIAARLIGPEADHE